MFYIKFSNISTKRIIFIGIYRKKKFFFKYKLDPIFYPSFKVEIQNFFQLLIMYIDTKNIDLSKFNIFINPLGI